LRGDPALLAERMGHRKGHFMPATLLQSQLDTLEEPSADEHAIVVDVAAPVEDLVRTITTALA
jgi:gluconate kinase